MPELDSLMDDLPDALAVDGGGAADEDDLGDEGEELDGADGQDEGTDGEEGAEGEEDGEGEDGADDKDDEFDVDLQDDEEEDKPPTAAATTDKPPITDEGQFILAGLPKIKAQVVVTGADGKDTVKEVEVYGWGDLPRDMKGFASPYEQGIFTASAQNNELEARKLQGQFRENKMRADTEAYTVKENRGIAKDLKTLRTEGLFPKFKGMPGSDAFNNSDGAKEFDKVVAFMNEQNDEAGKAANAGEAFYHISFRQAYRMLHPEQFDKTKQAKNKQTARDVARRVRSGGGTKPARNVQPQRVTNIADLAGEFASFVGSGK